MNVQTHEKLKSKIWEIANRLRGPYRPPQYRLVMLPMVVLRRLDCVLEPTKDAVLKKRDELEAKQTPKGAINRLLGNAADPNRKHPLYNTSPYTFARLLGDAENIAPNLVSYINSFSPTARRIFERFNFTDQIEKLDASNRLFTIVKAMTDVDLHPDRIDNLQMGYLFEHLVMRFQRTVQRGGGRPLHAARSHSPHGEPHLHRGTRTSISREFSVRSTTQHAVRAACSRNPRS